LFAKRKMLTLQHLPMSEFIQSELLKALRPRQVTPNLTLATIPIEPNKCFELWTPNWAPKGSGFTPLEIELIRRDCPRISKILSKLVWLMGAVCLSEDDWEVGDREPIYDWDTVVDFVRREGQCINPIVTRVIFTPQAITPIYDSDRKQVGRTLPQGWEISPAHWSIVFDDLVPLGQGYRLKQAGDWVSVDIWTGKPMRRDVRSGKFSIEYKDLYTSRRG
jgi:hypothetical protein